MQYEGNLYGKVSGKYIELGTTEEYESWNLILQKRIAELEAEKEGQANAAIYWHGNYNNLEEAKDKRIKELEDIIAEFIYVESEGGADE